MTTTSSNIVCGKRVVIFGLGQHGGGEEATKWCVRHGAAEVIVHDRQPTRALRAPLERLRGLPIKVRCGRVDPAVIRAADVVIKNPAVPRATPLLQEARRIETDLSLFLATIGTTPTRTLCSIAVTGTKGKSSTVSAIGYGLEQLQVKHVIAGNIGIPILSVLDNILQLETVVLEVSSFQIGDLHFALHFKREKQTPLVAWPTIAVCTNLYPDHLDYYNTMDAYLHDKAHIGSHQQAEQWLILNGTAAQIPYSNVIAQYSNAQIMLVNETSAQIDTMTLPAPLNARTSLLAEVVADSAGRRGTYDLRVHARAADKTEGSEVTRYSLASTAFVGRRSYSLALAYATLHCAGVIPQGDSTPHKSNAATEGDKSQGALFAAWTGMEHRMEVIGENEQLRFINDTAATIPIATQEAIRTIREREPQGTSIYLIAGGSDKRLTLDMFIDIATETECLFLLAGDATNRIVSLLDAAGSKYEGPFSSLAGAFDALLAKAHTEHEAQKRKHALVTKGIAILSPGCASFGMFRHEFARGAQWKQLVATHIAKPQQWAG